MNQHWRWSYLWEIHRQACGYVGLSETGGARLMGRRCGGSVLGDYGLLDDDLQYSVFGVYSAGAESKLGRAGRKSGGSVVGTNYWDRRIYDGALIFEN